MSTLLASQGVLGTLIVNNQGTPLRSTLDVSRYMSLLTFFF